MSDPTPIVFTPHGRLDALGARGLWTELESVTTRSGQRVLVDMTDTRYISSDGLRVLMRASRAVKERGGKLVLCCLNARITEIVDMAGLDHVLAIYPNRSAAQRALEGFSAGSA